jgi:two-component system, NarL family, response regulator DevR
VGATANDGGTAMTTRVFLLDDHEIVRRGVRELIETEGDFEVVGEAGTVAEALARIPPTRPDVALLDARLPDGSGVEVCREIRDRHPEVACVILTSFADDEALFDSIMAGAAGYLLKRARADDLLQAVRVVAAGGSLIDPALTARVLDRIRNPHQDDEIARLSPQERRILEHIGEGLTNHEIAVRMGLADKTVKNYVSHTLTKLGMTRRAEAAALSARIEERRRQAREG